MFAKTDQLIADMRSEFPRFRLLRKRDCRSQKLIHIILKVVTFGGQRQYISGYHTTIGQRIYLADSWQTMTDSERYILLLHERVHLEQFRRYTMVGMSFLYLFVFFPFGLAYFRTKFEKEAYEITLRAMAEHYGIESVRDGEFRAHIISQFVGPSYGWMWPFYKSVDAWYQQCLDTIETDSASGRRLT